MLGKFTAKLSFCGQVGAFSGFLAAVFFEWFNSKVQINTTQDLLVVGGVAWGVILFLSWGFYGVMVQYGWAQIARVTFFITLLSTALVFFLLNLINGPFALLIGFFTGMIIGIIVSRLCRLSRPLRRKGNV